MKALLACAVLSWLACASKASACDANLSLAWMAEVGFDWFLLPNVDGFVQRDKVEHQFDENLSVQRSAQSIVLRYFAATARDRFISSVRITNGQFYPRSGDSEFDIILNFKGNGEKLIVDTRGVVNTKDAWELARSAILLLEARIQYQLTVMDPNSAAYAKLGEFFVGNGDLEYSK